MGGDDWYVQIRRQGYTPLYKTFRTKGEGQAWAREQEGLIDKQQAPLDLRCLRTITLGDILKRYVEEVTPRASVGRSFTDNCEFGGCG